MKSLKRVISDSLWICCGTSQVRLNACNLSEVKQRWAEQRMSAIILKAPRKNKNRVLETYWFWGVKL